MENMADYVGYTTENHPLTRLWGGFTAQFSMAITL
jgi:hypothetical protein